MKERIKRMQQIAHIVKTKHAKETNGNIFIYLSLIIMRTQGGRQIYKFWAGMLKSPIKNFILMEN